VISEHWAVRGVRISDLQPVTCQRQYKSRQKMSAQGIEASTCYAPIGRHVQEHVAVPAHGREVNAQQGFEGFGRLPRVPKPARSDGRLALCWGVVGLALLPGG
jgi:hypothetical protein